MKFQTIYIFLLASLFFGLAACQKEEYSLGTIAVPSDLKVTYTLKGQDNANPYGDGSGIVNFSATANDEITYKFIYGDGRSDEMVASGMVEHQFTKTGTHTYNVTVAAVGKGGVATSTNLQVEVLSVFADPDAEEFLTGNGSKTWYWAADQPAHIGLGPSTPYDEVSHLFPAWWSIGSWDKDKACLYDSEFVFTKTETGITFEQTKGNSFIPGTYAGDIGVAGDVCHDKTVTPNMVGVKNVSFAPASSVATASPDYRGTAFSLSDNGFMGWWVGISEYEIIEITDNILRVRIIEDETHAWYHTFTSVKPVQ